MSNNKSLITFKNFKKNEEMRNFSETHLGGDYFLNF